MEKYICIHGHFYQPPRENPWLEEIEQQDSAYPYHDWNERITAECYASNAASRILDADGKIAEIVNNYSKISFNFGPTLLDWLDKKSPEIYKAVLQADKESRKNFGGHGSAMAQAYNHMIMPLANRRDKYTQVLWGIKNFEHHFKRKPEGMWLPETAVDIETLEILAELGIKFTVFSPYQANRVRKIGDRTWHDASGGHVDPSMAYLTKLPSGRNMSVFFYDGMLSQAVAFEKLLIDGERFAERLLGAFPEDNSFPRLVNIATDGETYGHHHRFGDMALAYAIRHIESNNLAQITNYGEYLEKYPPTHIAEIYENSSWSCVHGIERWRSNCGCNTGGRHGWNQSWRAPLREALDNLRDTLAPAYEKNGKQFFKDPWAARDDYISVILDRSLENVDRFLTQHAAHDLNENDKVTALKLLELQRQAMLMFTSCGWFFDELSGIETVQVIQYAGRAIELAEELFETSVEHEFLNLLEKAKSNIHQHRDGRHIYDKFVKPAQVNWEKLAAHYALSSLFEEYGEETKIYCYTIEREDYQVLESGKAKLATGRAKMTSQITRESDLLTFGVLHLGDHNLNAGARKFRGEEAYMAMTEESIEAFRRADFPQVIRLLDKHFEKSTYSIRSLFRDEQSKVLNLLLEPTLSEVEAIYRQLYEHQSPLMRFITDLRLPIPKAFQSAAEIVVNSNIRRAFEDENLDVDRIKALVKEAELEGVVLDGATLEYVLRRKIEHMFDEFFQNPYDLSLLGKLNAILELTASLPFAVNLWQPQNVYYKLMKRMYIEFRDRGDWGDMGAQKWVAPFVSLGKKLSIKLND